MLGEPVLVAPDQEQRIRKSSFEPPRVESDPEGAFSLAAHVPTQLYPACRFKMHPLPKHALTRLAIMM